MKIRDAHQTDAPVATYDPDAGIAILSTDGLPLWRVQLKPDGSLVVKAGSSSEHNGDVIKDSILIEPAAANYLILKRPTLVFPPSK